MFITYHTTSSHTVNVSPDIWKCMNRGSNKKGVLSGPRRSRDSRYLQTSTLPEKQDVFLIWGNLRCMPRQHASQSRYKLNLLGTLFIFRCSEATHEQETRPCQVYHLLNLFIVYCISPVTRFGSAYPHSYLS